MKTKKIISVAFAWWWTGWHVYPVKAIIERLVKTYDKTNIDINIYWIWVNNSLEHKICDSMWLNCVHFVSISTWKFRRWRTMSNIVKNFFDMFLILKWFFDCIRFFLNTKNLKVVFCKWWYVSLTAWLIWKLFWKKILLHESDMVWWLSNHILQKFSTINYVWFSWSIKNSKHVGQILSSELTELDNLINLELKDYKNQTIVTVSWWSQWSEYVYKMLYKFFKENHSNIFFHFFIILWSRNTHFKELFQEFKFVKTYDFLDTKQMWTLLRKSDIWITRWWATSLAEMKLFWLNLCIIPLPSAAQNHQYHNAIYYQKTYSDFLLEQSDKQFVMKLTNRLDNYKAYKKPLNNENLNDKINVNLDIIIKDIFHYSK